MKDNCKIDFYRHLSFAAVGGFFGAYAILCRGGVLANAQTSNLLELVIRALQGDGMAVLLHIGALLLYIVGTMITVLLPHYFGIDMHKGAPVIDAIVCVMLCFIPEDTNPMIAIYPIFFAMSCQWSSFTGARGYVSSTIFSTNNTKQASLAFAKFITDRDSAHFDKVRFYVATLLCFHAGAAIAFGAVALLAIKGAVINLALVANAYYMASCEREYERSKSEIPAEPVTAPTLRAEKEIR